MSVFARTDWEVYYLFCILFMHFNIEFYFLTNCCTQLSIIYVLVVDVSFERGITEVASIRWQDSCFTKVKLINMNAFVEFYIHFYYFSPKTWKYQIPVNNKILFYYHPANWFLIKLWTARSSPIFVFRPPLPHLRPNTYGYCHKFTVIIVVTENDCIFCTLLSTTVPLKH